jgi:hypothetical protein
MKNQKRVKKKSKSKPIIYIGNSDDAIDDNNNKDDDAFDTSDGMRLIQ